MNPPPLSISKYTYQHFAKPFFFRRDPELVHERMTRIGEWMGNSYILRTIARGIFRPSARTLAPITQHLFGITFASPLGLAAGFDYEAKLTHILPSLGFGFGTVGTLTHQAYGGNPRPMLGRLPNSKSLMVNKGFKNLGIASTLQRVHTRIAYHGPFSYPVGVSIGKTNTLAIRTQQEAIDDVIAAFKEAEASGVPFSYYELNISCPNLAGSVEFYTPEHLEELLAQIDLLSLTRPIFVKMPISNTDDEILGMMKVIVRHRALQAVILGNLQKDRKNPALVPEEAARFTTGNFSGAPCRARSDELIELVYHAFGDRIKIIGCGGVFTAEDAYRKIRRGASLIQLITGLVYEGPQLVAQIDRDLITLLRRDGFSSLGEAVGADVR